MCKFKLLCCDEEIDMVLLKLGFFLFFFSDKYLMLSFLNLFDSLFVLFVYL